MKRTELNALIVNKNKEHLVSDEMLQGFLYPELDVDFECLDKLIGLNDSAHQWGHILDVTLGALRIVEESPELYVYNCKVVACAALWHDSASGLDRDLHHVKGGALYNALSNNKASNEVTGWISEAIFTHRKSCGAEPSTPEAMAVAVADKGKPVQNYNDMLWRGVIFNAEKRGGLNAAPVLGDLLQAISHRWDILDKVQGDSEVWKAWRKQAGYAEWLALHDELPTKKDIGNYIGNGTKVVLTDFGDGKRPMELSEFFELIKWNAIR